jgi:hypothetical protein
MTVYYVDDGGSNTSPYDTWAKAAPDLQTLDTAVAFASNDIVYIGHNSICPATGNPWTLVGPTSGAPVMLISATQGSDPPAYQVGATIGTAATTMRIDGSFASYGITFEATGASALSLYGDTNEATALINCTLKPNANQAALYFGNTNDAIFKNLAVDLSKDETTARTENVINDGGGGGSITIQGLTFVNPAYRTGVVCDCTNMAIAVSGADFSGFTNGTTCEIVAPGDSSGTRGVLISHSKTAATWTPMTAGRPRVGTSVKFVNVGPSDAPTGLIERAYQADLVSSTAIYRTGGAAVEGDATAWLITTESTNSEAAPYHLPWMYGTVEAGSKTFTVHITNDTADLTDAEAWLEVEYLGTSDSPLSTLASDQRASPTATAAAQTDDTTSAWNGAGPSFTYKQKLAVTVTVGEAGQYRARVVVGKASIASSAYFYVDPKVVVS